MESSRRVPISLMWFGATIILFFLQAFQPTGTVLATYNSQNWSIYLINLGVISLLAESLLGQVGRGWAVIAIMWFGGYLVLVWQNNQAADTLAYELTRTDRDTGLGFDPTRQSLVVEASNGFNTDNLLRDFNLPVIYVVNPNARMAQHTAMRMARGEICERLRQDRRLRATGALAIALPAPQQDRCLINIPADPPLPPLYLKIQSQLVRNLFSDHTSYTVTLRNDQRSYQFSIATLEPYPAIPQPQIGCGISQVSFRWECFINFVKMPSRVLGGASLQAAIAQSLALKPNDGSSEHTSPALLESLLKAHEAILKSRIDLIIREPERRLSQADMDGAFDQPQLYASRAADLIDAMRRRMNSSRAQLETIKTLQRLLIALPDESFVPVQGRLRDALMRSKELTRDTIDSALLDRIVDPDPAWLPLLERMVGERPDENAGALMRILCRIGRPAAYLAPKLAANWMPRAAFASDAHAAAYIALLRFGRHDLLPEEPQLLRKPRGTDYDSWTRTITPDSSNEVCVAKGLASAR